MGVKVELVKNDLKLAERIFELSSNPGIKDALGIKVDKIEDTLEFLNFIMSEDENGKVVSRVVLNEEGEVIGHTGLKHIDRGDRICHIGSWIGVPYWGLGYNEASKIAILKIAFEDLEMDYVFAGAKVSNLRSRRAQEKLPYITLGVEKEFPNELAIIERETGEKCVLNVVKRIDFLDYINSQAHSIF